MEYSDITPFAHKNQYHFTSFLNLQSCENSLDYSQGAFVVVYYFSYKYLFDALGNNFKDEVTRKDL